ncbi:MAG: helix-turn-helix domain-containing protein [Dehalococcoidia bacterium]
MGQEIPGEYLTVAEAAKLLKVSQSTVWRWINRGEVPAYRVGQRRIRLRRDELAKIITLVTPQDRQAGILRSGEKESPTGPTAESDEFDWAAAIEQAKRHRAALLRQTDEELPASPSETKDNA